MSNGVVVSLGVYSMTLDTSTNVSIYMYITNNLAVATVATDATDAEASEQRVLLLEWCKGS